MTYPVCRIALLRRDVKICETLKFVQETLIILIDLLLLHANSDFVGGTHYFFTQEGLRSDPLPPFPLLLANIRPASRRRLRNNGFRPKPRRFPVSEDQHAL
jgi:hypothetical protein